MEKLPKNWAQVEIRKFAFTASGGTPNTSKKEYWDGEIPWINSGKLKDATINTPSKYITELALKESSAKLFPKNTVVIALTGATTGKIGLLEFETTTNQSVTGIFPNDQYDSRFLFFQLIFLRPKILANALGTAQPHINKRIVDETIIRFPPLAEQQRIAIKLDTFFSQIQIIKESLEKIPFLLKQFRQQVLHQATSGDLTEEWRQGRDLKKIDLNQCEKERESLKKENSLKNGKKTFKYKKSIEPILGANTKGINSFYDLPTSWLWASLDQVVWNISDGPHFSPKYVDKKVGKRFISMRNVSSQGIDFEDCKYVSIEDHTEFIKRGKPEKGDLLYTKGGSTGIACVIEDDYDFSYWVHVALLKPITTAVDSYFLKNTLDSELCYKQSQAFTHGVGNQDLGLTRMTNIVFPLPPLQEQQEIVSRIESLFTKADSIEKRYTTLKKELEKLPHAILHKAFKGELTQQLNNDGNARELLEQIKVLKDEIKVKKKEVKPIIIDNKLKVVKLKPTGSEIYKRTLLAAEIVYQLKDTFTLGHLKLQKMLYLCQEIENMNLPMNFLKQAMGPYDNQLARSLDKQFTEKKWFTYQREESLKYKPLENCGKHKEDFQKYFENQLERIDYLINKFRKFTSIQIEAVATLYACWKEAHEKQQVVTDKLIIAKFYQWSKEKEKFKEENLLKALQWMRNNNVIPKK